MKAQLLDGSRVAQEVLDAATVRLKKIQAASGVTPCLATVLVGEDPASVTYTRMKRKRCESIGMTSLKVELPAAATTDDLVARIGELARDPAVHGILLQHPVPGHIDERTAFEAIPVAKDVDGVTFGSFAQTWFGGSAFSSCTPGGIVRLLDAYGVKIEGMEAVVVGRSAILGKPMAGMLLQRNATVTICHSRTRDLGEVVRRADLVVAAVGKPRFVQGSWIKEGAVVVDAGYNPGNVGDVDFDAAAERASRITPVPGGVGPMTIAVLIDQTVEAAGRATGVGA